MTIISQIAPEELLEHDCLDERLLPPATLEGAKITSLELHDVNHPLFKKFVLATFAADLICYPKLSDQVTFERLMMVMNAFPQGFRTWFLQLPGDVWRPVGYTGWYPMSEAMFDTFQNHPEQLKDRRVVPTESDYLYLFNFSVAPYIKEKALTKPLMTQFIADIKRQNPKGLACITVSEDGIRNAERLGMQRTGSVNGEGVYTTAHPK